MSGAVAMPSVPVSLARAIAEIMAATGRTVPPANFVHWAADRRAEAGREFLMGL
jgi:hypothetical protein